jgi:large subunit ribosomal protein L10
MAKSKQQKQEIIKNLIEKLKKAKSLVFVNFDGLTVKEVEELRAKFREENIDYLVIKKTLARLAFKEAGLDVDPKSLEKGVAIAFGYDDEVAPARIIETFAKKHKALKSIGGVLENKFVDDAKIVELSKLPSKQELLAKVIGSINAPLSGFVNVLAGNLRGLVQVLNAIKESKS